MSGLGEVSILEDMRNYAVARIFLDNIPHLKAYWPMAGREAARMSLLFGADDMDGTISDTTRIYSMAGAEEQNPEMTTYQICALIRDAGFKPVERDSSYNFINTFAL
jgi:aminodeoxyfutalosine synthase